VLVAIARTLRMLRGACLLGDGKDAVVAVLDRHVALTVATCGQGLLPEDRERVERAAAS
jgi:hypothetical protein